MSKVSSVGSQGKAMPGMFGDMFVPAQQNLLLSLLAAGMAACLMVAGSSGLELAIILGLFGVALVMGDFGATGHKGKSPMKKVYPPLNPQSAKGPKKEPEADSISSSEDRSHERDHAYEKLLPKAKGPEGSSAWAHHQESAGDKQWYTQRIIEESRKHRWPIALRLLNEMQEAGHKPEAIVYNCMIGDCKKGSRLERANALFERMESEGIKANVITYTAMMNVCARRSDADEAVRLFTQMKERQVLPNNVTYNTLIQACTKARQPARAVEMLRDARREHGYAPEIKAQTSKELFDSMQETGLVPANMNFVTTMDAVVDSREPERANEIIKKLQPDDSSNKPELTREIFHIILEEKTRHDKFTLLQLRPPGKRASHKSKVSQQVTSPPKQAAVEERRGSSTPVDYSKKGGIFGKLLQDYRDDREKITSPPVQASASEQKSQGNSVNSITLISAFERSRSVEEAQRLLKTMRDTGCHPNAATYNAVLRICDSFGLGTEAAVMHKEMLQDNIEPDWVAYNLLISALAKGNDPVKAVAVVGTMQSTLHEAPQVDTFNVLMESCVRADWGSKAIDLFKAMAQNNRTPDVTTYVIALEAASQAGYWHLAVNLVTKMQEEGHAPDTADYANAITACARNGKTEAAKQLLQGMQSKSVPVTVEVYNALLSGDEKSEVKYVRDLQIFKDMQAAKVKPNAATFSSLLATCEKAAQVDKALELYEAMRASRVAPTEDAYAALFRTCFKAERYDKALELFETSLAKQKQASEIGIYNHAISAYRALGRFDMAFKVMEHVKRLNLKPNTSTYAELIHTCQRTSSGDLALRFLRELHEQRLRVDAPRWNSVMCSLMLSDQPQKVLELVEEMKEQKVTPNTNTYSTLISACERKGAGADAVKYLEKMHENRLSPQPATCASVVSLLATQGNGKEVSDFLQSTQERFGHLAYQASVSAAEKAGMDPVEVRTTKITSTTGASDKPQWNVKKDKVASDLASRIGFALEASHLHRQEAGGVAAGKLQSRVSPLDGEWHDECGKVATVTGCTVEWAQPMGNVRVSTLRMSQSGDGAVCVDLLGQTMVGLLSEDGSNLRWSSGDVWRRVA